MKRERLPKLSVSHRQPVARLDLALELFITAKQVKRVTPRTMRNYREFLQPFIDWLHQQGVTDAAEITHLHVRAYLAQYQERGLAAATVHTHAKHIKTWLRFLYRDEIIPVDVMAKVDMPRLDDKILPAFTVEEVKRLLAVCRHSPRETAVILCLLDTGCRADEFCKLKMEDLNLPDGEIMIHLGKQRKDRVVFLGPKSKQALQKYLITRPDATAADPIFPSERTGKPLTPTGLRLLLRRIGLRAGVAHCHPHTFRRTFATWADEADMNINALARLMGHADIKVLRKYLDKRKSRLRQQHDEHGPVDHML